MNSFFTFLIFFNFIQAYAAPGVIMKCHCFGSQDTLWEDGSKTKGISGCASFKPSAKCLKHVEEVRKELTAKCEELKAKNCANEPVCQDEYNEWDTTAFYGPNKMFPDLEPEKVKLDIKVNFDVENSTEEYELFNVNFNGYYKGEVGNSEVVKVPTKYTFKFSKTSKPCKYEGYEFSSIK